MFIGLPPSLDHIRSGKLRPLAATTATYFEALPDLPPVSDFAPGYEASRWWAIGVRKITNAEIIDRLNKEINAILVDHKIKERLADLGSTPLVGSPSDFGKLMAEETEKWAKVTRTHRSVGARCRPA